VNTIPRIAVTAISATSGPPMTTTKASATIRNVEGNLVIKSLAQSASVNVA
jgi:hypothetical protein